MPTPLGPSDFFALEAGEYLERLARLAATPGGPSAEEFVRYARALRGSALMANQPEITRAAGALEGVARSYREHAREWDTVMAEVVGQAVDDLKLLVRQARQWDADDSARADRLSQSLESISGRPPEGSRPGPARTRGELNAGVRAFVAREGALVASALDRAARALAADPGARDPLHNILRRMQSLRGLAALADLAPLPELLDSLELAVGDLLRTWAPPAGIDEVFEAAAQALTRASKDVADLGRPDVEAVEAERFAELLLLRLADDRDVVDIATLCPDGEASVVRAGTTVEEPRPVSLGSVELLTHGEYLAQAADEVERAGTAAQRNLRFFSLSGALDSARIGAAVGVGPALAAFGRAARLSVVSGAAAAEPAEFARVLRAAGALVRNLGPASDAAQASATLAELSTQLAAPTGGIIVPIESLAPDDDIVPIESLAPSATAPAPAPASPAAAEDASLAGSFLTYARLSQEAALPRAVADEAAANGGGKPAPPTAPRPAAVDDDVIEIDALLYRGQAALRRAAEIRHDLTARLRDGASLQAIRPLLDELLDLVPLALERSA